MMMMITKIKVRIRNIPETTRLNQSEFNAPFRLDLVRDSLSETLDRPLTSTVDAEVRHTALATNTGDLLDQTTLRRLSIAEYLHGGPGDIDEAEEIDLELLPDLGLGVLLEAAGQAVAGVVDDDVDALELGQRLRERLLDRLLVRHVQPYR